MSAAPRPVIILVTPQLGENIGMAARAMFNCGLVDLRLVAPRDGWPSEKALSASAETLLKMPEVQVFDTTAQAIADCHFVLATTARPRDMVKAVYSAPGAMAETRARSQRGEKVAILFGGERSGMSNDDIALAHAIITIPLNPEFTSLNLAQAVLLVAYEWMKSGDSTPPRILNNPESPPATGADMNGLLTRLEKELADRGFFQTEEARPRIRRNLETMFLRAEMTEQEVRTFHGIISILTGAKQTPPDKGS